MGIWDYKTINRANARLLGYKGEIERMRDVIMWRQHNKGKNNKGNMNDNWIFTGLFYITLLKAFYITLWI